jgi:hypothetical protein
LLRGTPAVNAREIILHFGLGDRRFVYNHVKRAGGEGAERIKEEG